MLFFFNNVLIVLGRFVYEKVATYYLFMEFLTDSLKEVVSKLSENQKEEIETIELIINTSETNKENTKEKVFHFIEKRRSENRIDFILGCVEHAAMIRSKNRRPLLFLIISIFNDFHLNFKIAESYPILGNMLHVEKIIHSYKYTYKCIFDFAKERTVGKAIFEDDIDVLRQLLATQADIGKGEEFYIPYTFFSDSFNQNHHINRIELAALFGSIKCFKYLMMNEDEINENTCKFAIAGGDKEIVHLCEQKGLKFEDCLIVSSLFHRFELFEWLNMHFNYKEIPLSIFFWCYNEPLFYFYSLSGSDVK